MALAPGSRLGPYEVQCALGAGGMGEVYRARDAKLNRDIALKILPDAFALDPERLARFQHEARTLAALNHPNIATIHGFEEAQGIQAIVMELVEGPTLADRIVQGPIPFEEALPIAQQIAEALEAAHEHGIIHRDLKPANIKVRPDGAVKVLDFGLAKAINPQASAAGSVSMSPTIATPAMSQLGMIIGTAAYMAPEQARGKPVDKRADIWGFGCVLYEMLSGRPAFNGTDVSEILAGVIKSEIDWHAWSVDTPAHVRRLVQRCLQKDPKLRLRDIGDARIALTETSESVEDVWNMVSPSVGWRRRVSLSAGIPVLFMAILMTGTVVWTLKPNLTPGPLPVVRFTVALPTGRFETFSWDTRFSGTPLALSSDGTQLAYVLNDRLYLRPLDSLETKPTLGTEGALTPFFSPDGQWVGFFAHGQLKKVSTKGGAAETLCAAPLSGGGSWSPDDTIYFAPSNASGLWKVPARGGTPQLVTALDRNQGEVSHRWPQVLPGGNRILFTVWRGPGWDEMDLQLLSLDTGARRTLVSGATTGRYVSSGHLVYARAGELTAVPFDLARLQITGPPVSLALQVLQVEGSYFAVSDAGTLAYVPGNGQFDRRLVWRERDGKSEVMPAPPRAYESIDISPDGQQVAFTISGPTWGIWIQDLVSNTQTLLTPGLGTSQWPVWTPDGNKLIYRGTRSGFRNLYWKPADGSGQEERLTTGENVQQAKSVSRDGKWLVFSESDPKTGPDIWVLRLGEQAPPKVLHKTPVAEDFGRFSPDGAWFSYESDVSGRNEIYVQPFPGPGAKVQVSQTGGHEAHWSKDGRALFFTNGDTTMIADVSTRPTFHAGTPRPLFKVAGPFDVAPDGRFLALQSPEPEFATQIHVVQNWFEELKRLVPRN